VAKVTGPQEIPSALLDDYRAALGEVRPDTGVRKRYPYRVPTMQTDVGHPSPKQKAQRDRFLIAKNNFAGVDWPTRQRWYAAMPEWGSLLWYYNFFIMSSLLGNANIPQGGVGVIKSIQNIKDTIPIGGKVVAIPVAIDTTKAVVMMWGSSYNHDDEEPFEGFRFAWAWPVYPIWSDLQANSIRVDWGLTAEVGADVSIQVIEYI